MFLGKPNLAQRDLGDHLGLKMIRCVQGCSIEDRIEDTHPVVESIDLRDVDRGDGTGGDDLSGVWRLLPGEDLEECGFPRPVWSDHPNPITLIYAHRDI